MDAVVGHLLLDRTCSGRSEPYLGISTCQKLLVGSSACLLALASGCVVQSTPPGTVSGHLEANGALPNTTTRLLPGTVVFTSSGGKSRSVEVATHGSIDIHLAPATWTATGHSPLVKSGSREIACHGLDPVVVHSGRTTQANVICGPH